MDAVAPCESPATAVFVIATGFFFFFLATAGDATPTASSTASAATPIRVIRLRVGAFSPVPITAILSAQGALLVTSRRVRVTETGRSEGLGVWTGPGIFETGEVSRMTRKRTRLALLGVMAVVLSVTVGLVSGSVAEAKKKKKKTSNVANVT